MVGFLLPPSLSGLSYNERKKLSSLNWKTGNIKDIEKGDYSFILISGQLYDNHKIFYDPGREILGIKPFFKNLKHKYFSDTYHQILFIETIDLAKFLFEYPKALQSYVLYESNAGMESLDPWKKFPRIWTVLTLQSAWQGIHFAFTSAAYLANQKGKKVVYLELNVSGLSIYSFLQKDPRQPVMHIREDRDSDPGLVLMERTTNYQNVDIINIQHLSKWKITYDQWVAIYNKLAIKYDHIFIHLGEDHKTFFHEDSDGVFLLRKNKTMGVNFLHPSENNDMWPPGMEIFTTSHPLENDTEIKYPLFYKNTIDVSTIPFYKDLDETYWKWFEKYPGKMFNQEKAVVLGESFPSLINTEQYVNQILPPNLNLEKFFHDNHVISEGQTSLYLALNILSQYSPITINKILKKIKPVYPQKGFYSYKSFFILLEDIFKELNLELHHLNFSSFSSNEHPVHWFTHGILSETLSQTVFPPLSLEPPDQVPQTRNFYSSNKSQWHEHTASAFRFGFKSIDFYEFIPPLDLEPGIFLERFSLSYNSIKTYVNLAGHFTRHNHIFTRTSNKMEGIPGTSRSSDKEFASI